MKIVHVIPGLDSEAPQNLRAEHRRALETASVSARMFSRKFRGSSLRVLEVCNTSWQPTGVEGIEVARAPIESSSVAGGASIRPVVGSFLAQNIVGNADYVIFSNADICFKPDFHEWVHRQIGDGCLAGSVHRATILGVNPVEPDSIQKAISTSDWIEHPGSDCFFFPASDLHLLQKSKLVMGVPKVGRHIVMTLAALNASFRVFQTTGVTFHFGDDRAWRGNPEFRKLTARNSRLFNWSAVTLAFSVKRKDHVRGLAAAKALAFGGMWGLVLRVIMDHLRVFYFGRQID